MPMHRPMNQHPGLILKIFTNMVYTTDVTVRVVVHPLSPGHGVDESFLIPVPVKQGPKHSIPVKIHISIEKTRDRISYWTYCITTYERLVNRNAFALNLNIWTTGLRRPDEVRIFSRSRGLSRVDLGFFLWSSFCEALFVCFFFKKKENTCKIESEIRIWCHQGPSIRVQWRLKFFTVQGIRPILLPWQLYTPRVSSVLGQCIWSFTGPGQAKVRNTV